MFLDFQYCHVADMNSWFHTATLAKLETPIESPDLRDPPAIYGSMTQSWTTPHHKSPLDEINEIRRNAADSLWYLHLALNRYYIVSP